MCRLSSKTLHHAGAGQVSVQTTAEVHRLQQEVELLRLKDLQQEHHIQVLTQQLRSSQPQASQVARSFPAVSIHQNVWPINMPLPLSNSTKPQ